MAEPSQKYASAASPVEGNLQVADGLLEPAVVYEARGRDCGQLSSETRTCLRQDLQTTELDLNLL